MSKHNILRIFVISCFLTSFITNSAFGLTESVDLFGEINSADLILNDIWLEPKNPEEGEAVSIHGSIYNAGIIPTGKVSDAVTIAYIVNGEIIEIDLLDNIEPGIENGIQVSSGPVLDSKSGIYIITVITNFHDTLSHLRDNPENNIIQKKFTVGNDSPVVITSEILQHYNTKTEKQEITINGQLNNFFQETLSDQKIIINVGESVKEEIITDSDGVFSKIIEIPYKNEIIKITMNLESESSLLSSTQIVYPIKLNKDESIISFETISETHGFNFHNSEFTIVLFQDSYENVFKKIFTNKHHDQDIIRDNIYSTIVPSNHEYIIEIYYEGRFLDAFQTLVKENTTVKKDIFIPEHGQVKFKVVDEFNEPQNNVTIENWIYSSVTNKEGITNWVEILPTIISSEPYVAKATFSDGTVTWSEPFLLESNEKKTISIVKGQLPHED